MDEEQKEIIKASAEGALKEFWDLIQRMFGPAADEVGTILRNEIMVRRIARERKLFEKVQRMFNDADIQPDPVPDKIWTPLLQAAAVEDDDFLQEQFAALLANAADPEQSRPVLPEFPDVLSRLSSNDAIFINAILESAITRTRTLKPSWGGEFLPTEMGFERADLLRIYADAGLARDPSVTQLIPHGKKGWQPVWEKHTYDIRNFDLVVETALRHGLIEESAAMPEVKAQAISQRDLLHGQVTPKVTVGEPPLRYFLTNFGVAFMEACSPPRK